MITPFFQSFLHPVQHEGGTLALSGLPGQTHILIQKWTYNTFFAPAWLQDVGACIQLGHEGSACPMTLDGQDGMSSDEEEAKDDWVLEEEGGEVPDDILVFTNPGPDDVPMIRPRGPWYLGSAPQRGWG
ncbi:hypothetical protein AcW1_007397 [Taiwanofungus camphoratus]|nr:hypothetical protein AcW1_007397 [Antrodia cinnamomea]